MINVSCLSGGDKHGLCVSPTISAKNTICFGVYQILKTTSTLFSVLSCSIIYILTLFAHRLTLSVSLGMFFSAQSGLAFSRVRCPATRSTILFPGIQLLYDFCMPPLCTSFLDGRFNGPLILLP